jgi:hypothetical protein
VDDHVGVPVPDLGEDGGQVEWSCVERAAQDDGAVLGIAMGIQNAAARKIAVPGLTTTVLTLTITGIAADNGLAGGQVAKGGGASSRWRPCSPARSSARRSFCTRRRAIRF